MSTLQKDHVFGAGGSALAGGAVGGAVGGLLAGVPGFALGAAAGGALGAVVGHKAAEARDKRGDLGHFQQIYQAMPYYIDGMAWTDYAPAYRLGLDSYTTRGATPIDQARDALVEEWTRVRGISRLSWPQAEPAVAHVWDELDKSLGGKGV
jgi:hypothetical protein